MGPSGQLLQRMAKKWDMHVVGTFYAWGTEPNSSDLAYNSGAAPLRFASLSHPKRAGMGLKLSACWDRSATSPSTSGRSTRRARG